jgi:Zn finger protein HypA/HybF involved in hydrogenase expression
LAKELWPQLLAIAEAKGFRRVVYVEMIVGMLHGVTADALEDGFEHSFHGSSFQGADVEISVVDPGEEYISPGTNEKTNANGWELLIVRMDGEE